MARAAAERKHEVRCTLNVPELTKAGTSGTFEVHPDGVKIGTMVLGRGSVTWYGGKRRTGTQFSWSEFARIMDRECYGGR